MKRRRRFTAAAVCVCGRRFLCFSTCLIRFNVSLMSCDMSAPSRGVSIASRTLSKSAPAQKCPPSPERMRTVPDSHCSSSQIASLSWTIMGPLSALRRLGLLRISRPIPLPTSIVSDTLPLTRSEARRVTKLRIQSGENEIVLHRQVPLRESRKTFYSPLVP